MGIRNLKRINLLFWLIFTLSLPNLFAATLYVDCSSGSDINDCSDSGGNACATIQHAIDSATPNDTIQVSAGECLISSPINFGGNDFILQGSGISGSNMTRLLGTNTNHIITFDTSETSASVVRNFVMHAYGASSSYHGIYIDGADPTIERNVIVMAPARTYGSGVRVYSGSPIVKNNIFISGATGVYGSSTTTVINNLSVNANYGFQYGDRVNNIAVFSPTGLYNCNASNTGEYNFVGRNNNNLSSCSGQTGTSEIFPRFIISAMGKITSISTASGTELNSHQLDTITDSSASWSTNEWAGYFFTPDYERSTYPEWFLVISNTSTTLTVTRINNSSYEVQDSGSAGSTYMITQFKIGSNSPVAAQGTTSSIPNSQSFPTVDIEGTARSGVADPGPYKASGTGPHATADTLYVSTSGTDSFSDQNPCTNSGSPCETITFALANAHSGDTIDIAAGDYALTGSQSLDLSDRNLIFQGAGVNAANMTRIVGSKFDDIFKISGGQTANSTIIRGFVLQTYGYNEDAINIASSSSATVEKNVIIMGSGSLDGTAVDNINSTGTVVKNNIIMSGSIGVNISGDVHAFNNTLINNVRGISGDDFSNNLFIYNSNGSDNCSGSNAGDYNFYYQNTDDYGADADCDGANDIINTQPQYKIDYIGISTSISTNTGAEVGEEYTDTLTDSSASWTVNQWKGHFVTPNINRSDYPMYFLIVSNTSDTLTISRPGESDNELQDYGAAGDYYQITQFDIGTNSPLYEAGTNSLPNSQTFPSDDLFEITRSTQYDIGAIKANGTGPSPSSKTLYIATDGTDVFDSQDFCSDSENPCATIEWALLSASEGSTINLASGDYAVTETINPGSKNVVFAGAGTEGSSLTRLLGSVSTNIFTFNDDIDNTTIIKNLVIQTYGNTEDAIILSASSSPVIEQNIIFNATGTQNGYSIYLSGSTTNETSTAHIQNNIILGANYGPYVGRNSTVNNNIITDTGTAFLYGGDKVNNIAVYNGVGYRNCSASYHAADYNLSFANDTDLFSCSPTNHLSVNPQFIYEEVGVVGVITTASGTEINNGQLDTFAVSGASWSTNEWKGKFLLTNINQKIPKVWFIISNTSNTITITRVNNSSYEFRDFVSEGDLFAITQFHIGTNSPAAAAGTTSLPNSKTFPTLDFEGTTRSGINDLGAMKAAGTGPSSVAKTLYVSSSGTDTLTTSSYCQNSESPCASARYAAAYANDGDTIQFSSGNYSISETISDGGKTLDFIGAGTQAANITLLSGGSGIGLFSLSGDSSSISQFIIHAYGGSENGIELTADSNTVEKNVIVNGPGTDSGYGVYVNSGTNSTIRNNLIVGGQYGILAGTSDNSSYNTVINHQYAINNGTPFENIMIHNQYGVNNCDSDSQSVNNIIYNSSTASHLNCSSPYNDTDSSADPAFNDLITQVTSSSIGANTITVNSAGWTTDEWKGNFVTPDINRSGSPLYYLILSNTTDTLTVAYGANEPVNEDQSGGETIQITDFSPSGSGVVDSGTNSGAPSTDVYGNARPFNSTVDIGGVEQQASIGTLTSTNVEPASLILGNSSTVTVSFTNEQAIPNNGKIEITFGSNFDLTNITGGDSTCSSMDGSFITSVSSQTVTIERAGGSTESAAAETCTIANIVNPTSTGSTGTYLIQTLNSSDQVIDTSGAVSADTITQPSITLSSATQSVDEGVGTVTITASVSESAGVTITLPYTVSGTASDSSTDHNLADGNITVTAGQTTGSVSFSVTEDTLDENAETVIISTGTPTNASVGATTTQTITINDNDNAPTIQFSTASQSPDEDAGTVTVTLSLNTASGLNASVPYTISGTATASGTDHDATGGTATITAGNTSTTINFNLTADSLDEAAETVILTLGSPTNSNVGSTTTHTVNIQDVNTPPSATFTASTQSIDENVGTVTLTANISAVSGQTVTLPFTVSGTATGSGTDHDAASGNITISAGLTQGTYVYNINDDSLYETSETVITTMGTPTNASQGATTVQTVTISDNDTLPSVQLTASSQSTTESTSSITITAELNTASGTVSTIPYTISGTATASGTDHDAADGSFSISAGSTQETLTINLSEDTLDENDETIILTLGGSPTNASLGSTTIHTATITDNDDPSTLEFTASTQSVTENVGSVTVTAQLDKASGLAISVPFTISGTSTGSGTDHDASDSTINISAGNTTGTYIFNVINDSNDEAAETVIATLDTPTNASLASTTAQTITINDNDDPPTVQFNASSQTANENAGTVTVTATLDTASGYTVTVPYTISGTSTGSGTDHDASSGTLTFSPGDSSENISIALTEDSLDEINETLIISLGSPINASLGSTTVHTLTINDSNSPPTVQLTASSQSVSEADGSIQIAIESSAISGLDITVPYTISGTSDSSDHNLVDGSATISAGQTNVNIPVTLTNDSEYENPETLIITLGSPTNAGQGSTLVKTITLNSDDLAPSIQFNSSSQSVAESVGTVTVTVDLATASQIDASVPYTISGTATGSGTDYTLSSGTFTITAGQTSTQVQFSVTDDSLYESTETVILSLGSPTASSLGTNSSHIISITDNDSESNVQFSSSSQSANEDVGSINLTISLDTIVGSDLTIPYTVSGTAIGSGTDHNLSSGQITISAGSSTGQISITIIDDSLFELSETVIITLTDPSEAGLGAQTTHTITIADNDTEPSLDFNSATQTVTEADGTITLALDLSSVSGIDVTVPYTVSGTATGPSGGSGTDHNLTAGTATISAGQSSGTIQFTVIDDTIDESSETVVVILGTPSNANTGTTTSHAVTITDNDDPPSIAFTNRSGSSDESTASVNIGFTLSAVSSFDTSVDYSISGGDASPGSDYSLSNGTVTISAGQSTANLSLSIADDSSDEDTERLILSLSNPSQASLGDNNIYTHLILDNDETTTAGIIISHSQGKTQIRESEAIESNSEISSESEPDYQLDYVLVSLKTQPTSTVQVNLADGIEYEVYPKVLLFSTDNWNIPQTLSFAATSDQEVEGTQIVNINLDLETTDSTYSTLGVTFPITIIDDDAPGVEIQESQNNNQVVEGSTSDNYQVRLFQAPIADVTLSLATNTEVSSSPSSLIFTTENWNTYQTVTLTAVDDSDAEGEHSTTLTYSVSSTGDSDYNILADIDLNVDIVDNDAVGVIVTHSGTNVINLTEAGAAENLSVSLTQIPTSDVVISLSSDGRLDLNPGSLTFSSENYGTPQIVAVSAEDDSTDLDLFASQVEFSTASSDLRYQDLDINNVVSLITDDDVAGFTVSSISANTTESGGTASFTVKLNSEPLESVSINLSSSDSTEGSVSPSTLTFTSSNWNQNQTVTVTGIDDEDDDENITFTVILAAAESNDTAYDGLNPSDVSVINEDNDLGLEITSLTDSVVLDPGESISIAATVEGQGTLNYSWTSTTGLCEASSNQEWRDDNWADESWNNNRSGQVTIHTNANSDWMDQDWNAQSTQTISYTYRAVGEYCSDTLTLTVTDDQEQSVSQSLQITVLPPAPRQGISETPIVGSGSGHNVTAQRSTNSEGQNITTLTFDYDGQESEVQVDCDEYNFVVSDDNRLAILDNCSGQICIYSDDISSSSSELTCNIVSPSGSSNQLGRYLSSGDIDGDGEYDFFISDPGAGDYGIIYIYDRDANLLNTLYGSSDNPASSILSENLITGSAIELSLGPDNLALNSGLTFNAEVSSSQVISQLALLDTSDTLSSSVYFSDGLDIDWTFSSNQIQSFATGDVNQDSNSDMLISSASGVIYGFFGPFSSGDTFIPSEADFTITGPLSCFGQSLIVGDVTGDTLNDIVIGSPCSGNNSEGAIYVVFGTDALGSDSYLNFDTTADIVMELNGSSSNGQIGSDLLLADNDENSIPEIYSITSSNQIYSIELDEAAISNSGSIRGGGGCSLNEQSQTSSFLLINYFWILTFSALLILRRKVFF